MNLHSQTTSITVVSPNGGETWYALSNQTVQWTFTGSPPTVNIYLSTDNGVTWNNVASLVASGSSGGTHTMIVPLVTSNQCLIKVVDAVTPSIKDSSNSVFSIVQPSITVVTPNGSEIWNIGSTQNIKWNSVGSISAVDIEETRDNGATWNVIQMGVPNGSSGGTYAWLIGGSASTQCKVRIRDFMFPPIQDESDAVFTIMAPSSIAHLNFESINVYPNPTPEHLTMELPSGMYALTLTDMKGKTITQSNIAVHGGIITFNLSNVPQGMYILRLQDANQKTYIQKIEKM
ncbi:MAG: T9SS type A sorting domain-containing protein [Bacteroidia bacterium]|nr:T9SS type A sorting domain-containing protein [Bacteroidia bacterium]MDW8303176.1 T9SS type A sorting domain-containing protein [Bacteroidia bacterium]